jgi:hypothetical protein
VTESAPAAREILLLLPAAAVVLVVVAAPAGGGGQWRRRSAQRRRRRPENGTVAGTLRDAKVSHTALHPRWDTATESSDSER